MDSFKPIQSLNLKKSFQPLVKKQNQYTEYLLAGLAFLIPVFFLPVTADFFMINKTSILYIVTIVFIFYWAVKIFTSQKLKILKNPLNVPMLGLMVVYTLSSLLQAPNQISSLSNQTGLIICFGLLFFAGVNFLKGRKGTKLIFKSLIISSVVLSWSTILAYLEILSAIGIPWLQNKAWSPTGSPLTTGILLFSLVPATFFWAFKNNNPFEKILYFLAGGLQIAGVFLIASLYIDGTLNFVWLYPNFGWQIAVEGFKNLKTALLGVGPGNFLSAFNLFRPVGLNNTPFWSIKFQKSTNQFFHLLSTVGILGLFFYLWIIIKSLKRENLKGSLITKVLYIFLLTNVVIQVFLPIGMIPLFTTFLAVALLQVVNTPLKRKKITARYDQPAVVWGSLVLFLIICFGGLYWQGRKTIADVFYRRSLLAAQNNNGGLTYNMQIKAIKFNPFAVHYRMSYSNTNIALANSLSQQKDLTDQKKNNITQLIRQAIREAKATVSLNPQRSSSWVNLANIYKNIINITKDAQQWTIASYLQAVKTNPTSPLLRVEFGSLFYALKDYEQAVNQFTQAVNLKPDYANAYYNLGAAYYAREDWQRAYINLQKAMNLVPMNSEDYQRVDSELKDIEKKISEKGQKLQTPQPEPTQQTQEITPPEALPTPQPEMEQIELPEEAGPEIPEPEETPEAEENLQEEQEATDSSGI